MRVSFLHLLVGIFAVLLSGVVSAQIESGGASSDSNASEASSSYVIRPLDYLRFRIIGEPETQMEMRVSADGSVALPYVQTVSLENLTVQEAQRKLYELYNGDYFVNPQIDLTIIAYGDRSVEVLGYVGKQGSVPFPSEKPLYLLEAISRAGGFQELGNRRAVEVRRVEDGETKEKLIIDTTSISPRDFPLLDGDIINVPRRVW